MSDFWQGYVLGGAVGFSVGYALVLFIARRLIRRRIDLALEQLPDTIPPSE